MADIATIFDWLAFLATGLMAITIPTYAISVSFLGRETKRSLVELENRNEDLKKKTAELTNQVGTESGLVALKAEIASYEKDISRIKGRLRSLSVWGAFVYPFFSFGVALVCAGYGFAIYTNTLTAFYPALTVVYWGALSIAFSSIGIVFLGNTLFHVNQAALSPESLSTFRLSFDNGSTVKKFPVTVQNPQQPPLPTLVRLVIHNYGKELAENVMVMIFFPSDFTIQPGGSPVLVGVQPDYPSADYPGSQSVTALLQSMHEDTFSSIDVILTMPSQIGSKKVPVHIWEKRLGKNKYELTFEVA